MIAKTLGAAALLAIAGSAMAQSMTQTYTSTGAKVADPGMVFDLTRGTPSHTVQFNIGPNNSMDGPVGDTSNVVLLLDVAAAAGFPSGTPCVMTGIGWNVNQQAVGASWLSEMRMYFDDAVAPDLSGLFLTTSATGSPNGNLPQNNVSAGILDLSANAIPNINLPNGILRLELFESYEDVENGIDGLWLNPSLLDIAVNIPSPGAMGLLGLAGVATLGRKRR